MTNDDNLVHSVEWRCEPCRRIPWDFKKWPQPDQRADFFQHHESLAALEESAALGCYLCRTLRAHLIHGPRGMDHLNPGRCWIRLHFGSTIREQNHNFYVGKHSVGLPIRRAALQDIPWNLSATIKRLSPQTLDDDLGDLVQQRVNPWVNDCINGRGSHVDCGQLSFKGDDTFFLPTRLIDIGDGESRPTRLILARDELIRSPKPSYLALSYCWGRGNESAKTTRANLEERKRGINVATLPKTIQDAIKLTQLMGIRYLWVDAVCIIQPHSSDPNLEDWNLEAPQMASYYSNAHCLISALGSSDSSQGMFVERLAERYPVRTCLVAWDSEQNEHHYLSISEPHFRHEFPRQPLLSRGWCLQERLLSRRVLHWSENCLIWQCNSLPEASEADPDGTVLQIAPLKPRYEHMIFKMSADTALGSVWVDLAEIYSRLSFTHDTDRLMAIQGLASRLASLHGDEYFAGVFRSRLSEGLLWAPNFDDPNRRVLPYFPTWSWASHVSDGRVRFDSSGNSLVQCQGPDLFPPVRSAANLEDPLNRVLRFEAPMQGINMGDAPLPKFPPHVPSFNRTWEAIIWGLEVQVRLEFDAVQLIPEPLGNLHVLFLAQYLDSQLPRTRISVQGLILRPKGQFYERIGYAELRTEKGSPEKYLEWEAELDKSRKAVALV